MVMSGNYIHDRRVFAVMPYQIVLRVSRVYMYHDMRFHPLEVAGHGRDAQPQVAKNLVADYHSCDKGFE